MNPKEHWEKVYQSKNFHEVSWYQTMPSTSIDFLQSAQLPKNAKIIDVGGGESNFVDYLLTAGYEDITVLDISENAIAKKKQALGEKAPQVKWIIRDIVDFQPVEQYDFWHDCATFHFLTQPCQIDKYLQTIRQYIAHEGTLVMGTFSESGPAKCSGLEIKQYSEVKLVDLVSHFFHKIKCITTAHHTPFDTIQDFIFCSFRKLSF
jgi:2-polyprenyl-3-methyl-5-hydroxy-6-metoxy-1,4-benzoquinol methylase